MKKFILFALFSLVFVGFKGYEKPPDKVELATVYEVELEAADLVELVRLDGVEPVIFASITPQAMRQGVFKNQKTGEASTRERDLWIFYNLKNHYVLTTILEIGKHGRAEKDPGNAQNFKTFRG